MKKKNADVFTVSKLQLIFEELLHFKNFHLGFSHVFLDLINEKHKVFTFEENDLLTALDFLVCDGRIDFESVSAFPYVYYYYSKELAKGKEYIEEEHRDYLLFDTYMEEVSQAYYKHWTEKTDFELSLKLIEFDEKNLLFFFKRKLLNQQRCVHSYFLLDELYRSRKFHSINERLAVHVLLRMVEYEKDKQHEDFWEDYLSISNNYVELLSNKAAFTKGMSIMEDLLEKHRDDTLRIPDKLLPMFHFNIADLAIDLGDFEKARYYLDFSNQCSLEDSDRIWVAVWRNYAVVENFGSEPWQNTFLYLQKITDFERKFGSKQNLALALMNLASHCNDGTLISKEKGTSYFEEAVQLVYKETASMDFYKSAGAYLMGENKLDEAFKFFRRGLGRSFIDNEDYTKAFLLQDIGVCESLRGNKNAALGYYTKAYNLFQKLKMNDGMGELCLDFGDVHFDLKNFEEALSYYKKAKKHFQDQSNEYYFIYVDSALGEVLSKLTKHDEAINMLNNTWRLAKDHGDKLLEARVVRLMGSVYKDNSQIEKAFDWFEIALEIYRREKYTVFEEELFNELQILVDWDSSFKDRFDEISTRT